MRIQQDREMAPCDRSKLADAPPARSIGRDMTSAVSACRRVGCFLDHERGPRTTNVVQKCSGRTCSHQSMITLP